MPLKCIAGIKDEITKGKIYKIEGYRRRGISSVKPVILNNNNEYKVYRTKYFKYIDDDENNDNELLVKIIDGNLVIRE